MRPRFRHQGGFAYIQILMVIAISALLGWQRTVLLAPLGTFPNFGEESSRAEVIVVLAVRWDGERILKAGELVGAEFAPYALLSGSQACYRQFECSAALPFAIRNENPSEYFQCATLIAKSTGEEARALIPERQRRQVKRLLLARVDTHLRRAPEVRKAVLLERPKLISSQIGI